MHPPPPKKADQIGLGLPLHPTARVPPAAIYACLIGLTRGGGAQSARAMGVQLGAVSARARGGKLLFL